MMDGRSRTSVGAIRSAETENAVLDAAETILLEQGYRKFSIEAVARAARAGKATLYRWWPTKARLLIAVYDRHKETVADYDTGSLTEDITLFFDTLFAFWRRRPLGDIFRLILAEAQSDPDAFQAMSDYVRDRRRQTARIFERARARGELTDDMDIEIAAETVMALAWHRLLTDRLDAPPEELRTLARQVAEGLHPLP